MGRFFTVLGIVATMVAVFLLYITTEQAVTDAKAKEVETTKKTQQLINDAYIMGASVYRSQALMLVADSTITRMDTLFIWETKDINDSLAIEAAQNFDL